MVEGAVLHVLCDDHDRVAPRHNPLQEDHVGVLELPHDGGLCEEVHTGLVRRSGLWSTRQEELLEKIIY